jgi:hypothetical protein
LYRILVLSHGQIVEQGTHKELLNLGGIFAKMWADQVNADRRVQSLSGGQETSGLGIVINDVSPQIELTGYDVGPAIEPAPEDNTEPANVIFQTGTLVDEPAGLAESVRASITVPETTDKVSLVATGEAREGQQAPQQAPERAAEEHPKPVEEVETASQAPKRYTEAATAIADNESSLQDGSIKGVQLSATASTAPAAAPIAFPSGGDDAASSKSPSVAATASGGITFSPEVKSTPSRSGSPDPEIVPKRKRISSQNFQRLAKKITMVRRNSSSASFDADASTSDLESPGGTSKSRKSKLKRRSTALSPSGK